MLVGSEKGLVLIMDTMVKARLNSVGGNRMTREEVGNPNVAEIVREDTR